VRDMIGPIPGATVRKLLTDTIMDPLGKKR
jgi:hypothetical protein